MVHVPGQLALVLGPGAEAELRARNTDLDRHRPLGSPLQVLKLVGQGPERHLPLDDVGEGVAHQRRHPLAGQGGDAPLRPGQPGGAEVGQEGVEARVALARSTGQSERMTEPQLRRLLLTRLEATDDDNAYLVEFADAAGAQVSTLARIDRRQAGQPVVVGVKPDVFLGWGGDAESARSVVAAVLAFDRARELSPLRSPSE